MYLPETFVNLHEFAQWGAILCVVCGHSGPLRERPTFREMRERIATRPFAKAAKG